MCEQGDASPKSGAGRPVGANVYDDAANEGDVLAPQNNYWEF